MAEGSGISRREGLGLAAGLCGSALMGSAFGATRRGAAIDVHTHFSPPSLRQAERTALTAMVGVPAGVRDWTPERSLESMDRNGIALSVVNASWRSSLLQLDQDRLRAAAREANDYAARMRADHPGRFDQFAFLPMPDIDGSLHEIEYCLDVLKAAGVGLMTSYDGKWQGDAALAPVLQELNRRAAVVFCHPNAAPCCGSLMPNISSDEGGLLEFPYDTGRAIFGLLLSGSFARYPDIRWIFCHCGGPLPALAGRIAHNVSQLAPETLAGIAPRGVDHELTRQFYDTANAAYGPSLAALRAYVPPTQILFGTDFPYISVEDNLRELEARKLPPNLSRAILSGNARRLIPTYA